MPVLNLKQEKVKLRCLYTCENDVVRTITCFVLLRQRERERERERITHAINRIARREYGVKFKIERLNYIY